MYTKRHYGFWLTFTWSKKPFLWGIVYSGLVTAVYYVIKKYTGTDISIAWQPISLLGIAVAFYLGFKNNASYDRTWEARKIWGGIVNSSRTFGAAVNAFIIGDNAAAIKKRIIYRHISWLMALCYQLRLSREWEHTSARMNLSFFPDTSEKYFAKVQADLCNYLDKEEAVDCLAKANPAAQLIKYQATELQQLKNSGYFNDLQHMEFHKLLGAFYDDQGRSERIKNFPFPRQYASAALWQTYIFAALMPFGMLNFFNDGAPLRFLITIPFTALTTWSFFLMEKIGDYSENPFEGTYNDVPISSISRGIEIDLRQMIDDTNIPAPLKSQGGYLL